MNKSKVLTEIYDSLFKSFGKQYWWPGDTDFEVVIGAILTQNTNWTNVEKAIRNLKTAKVFTPKKLYEIDIEKLAELIKPSGYFNVKAKRLKHFIEWLFANYNGSLAKLFKQDFTILREELLSVNGIGKETADSIILYAAEKPTFVVDAYTKRVLVRHGLITEDYDYEAIKAVFEDNLPGNVLHYNEYHALIVMVGKHYCKPKMQCEECPLENVHRTRLPASLLGGDKRRRGQVAPRSSFKVRLPTESDLELANRVAPGDSREAAKGANENKSGKKRK